MDVAEVQMELLDRQKGDHRNKSVGGAVVKMLMK